MILIAYQDLIEITSESSKSNGKCDILDKTIFRKFIKRKSKKVISDTLESDNFRQSLKASELIIETYNNKGKVTGW